MPSRLSACRERLLSKHDTTRLSTSTPQKDGEAPRISDPVLAEMKSWLATPIDTKIAAAREHHGSDNNSRLKSLSAYQTDNTPRRPPDSPKKAAAPAISNTPSATRTRRTRLNYATPTKSSIGRVSDGSTHGVFNSKLNTEPEPKKTGRVSKSLSFAEKRAVIKNTFGVSICNPALLDWALNAPLDDVARVFGRTGVTKEDPKGSLIQFPARKNGTPDGLSGGLPTRQSPESLRTIRRFTLIEADQVIPRTSITPIADNRSSPPSVTAPCNGQIFSSFMKSTTPPGTPPSSPPKMYDTGIVTIGQVNTSELGSTSPKSPKLSCGRKTPPGWPGGEHFPSRVDHTPSGTPYYISRPDVEVPVTITVTPPKDRPIMDSEHSFTIWESDSDKSKSPPLSPTHPANMRVEDMGRFVNGMTSFHEMLELFQQR